jgi:mannose-6-phosphate isomerase
MTASTVGPRTPTVLRLEGNSVTAAWGAPDLLADFSARRSPRSGPGPLAEVWFGAHPRHPSTVVVGGERRAASELADDARPALLVKLIAVGGPLSIQVHPDDATAREGFAREELAGVPLDAPARRYGDPSGKPELVRALGPMRALCGFRRAAVSRALLAEVAPRGAELLLEALAPGDAGLADATATLLRADDATVADLQAAIARGAREVELRARDRSGGTVPSSDVLRCARLAFDLIARFPGDRGTLVALLLEDIDLAPGDALHVAPGTPHAYLSGLGVEVMSPSDNVLRCGLTVKPVDVAGFLDVLDATAIGVPSVGALARRADGSGWRRFVTPTEAFVVDEAFVDGALEVERSGGGPTVLLCTAGDVTVRAGDGSSAELRPGGAVLLAPGRDRVALRGAGHVVHAGPALDVSPRWAGPTSA